MRPKSLTHFPLPPSLHSTFPVRTPSSPLSPLEPLRYQDWLAFFTTAFRAHEKGAAAGEGEGGEECVRVIERGVARGGDGSLGGYVTVGATRQAGRQAACLLACRGEEDRLKIIITPPPLPPPPSSRSSASMEVRNPVEPNSHFLS